MRSLLGEAFNCIEETPISRFPGIQTAAREIEFIEARGLIVERHSFRPSNRSISDPTDTECLINKWHVEDFLPRATMSLQTLAIAGAAFAAELLRKARRTLDSGTIRAIVSVQKSTEDLPFQTCTVRLHKLRAKHPWLDENLENYKKEAILYMDANKG
jgi:hypothetical protein